MKKQIWISGTLVFLCGFVVHSCSKQSVQINEQQDIEVKKTSDITRNNLRSYIIQSLNTSNTNTKSNYQSCLPRKSNNAPSNMDFKQSPMIGEFAMTSPYRYQSSKKLYWDLCSVGMLNHLSLPKVCSLPVLGNKMSESPVFKTSIAEKYAEVTRKELKTGQLTENRRLPTLNELSSLVLNNCENPSVNLTIFPNTIADKYWATGNDGNGLYTVDFANGAISKEVLEGEYSLRLVRSTVPEDIRSLKDNTFNIYGLEPKFRD